MVEKGYGFNTDFVNKKRKEYIICFIQIFTK